MADAPKIELIMTQNPNTGRPVDIEVVDRTSIEGGVEEKHRLHGIIRLIFKGVSRLKHISLIERHPFPPTASGDIFETWQKLKKAGLPVVPTLRVTDSLTLVETDLKAHGAEIYGKATDMYGEGRSERESHGLSSTDKLFVEKYDSIREKIQAESLALADKTSQVRIKLPYDDPTSLIFNPDGSWQLIILDVRQTGKIEGEPTQEDIEYNRRLALRLIGHLDKTYQEFKSIETP